MKYTVAILSVISLCSCALQGMNPDKRARVLQRMQERVARNPQPAPQPHMVHNVHNAPAPRPVPAPTFQSPAPRPVPAPTFQSPAPQPMPANQPPIVASGANTGHEGLGRVMYGIYGMHVMHVMSDEDALAAAIAASLEIAAHQAPHAPVNESTSTSTHSPVPAPQPMPAPQPQTAQAIKECPVCLDDKVDADFYRLSCGHEVCRDCLKVQLRQADRDKATAGLRCTAPGCRVPFTDKDIANIVGDDRDLARAISDVQCREYLATNPNARPCPTPGCPFWVEYDGASVTIECPVCHHRYCTHCRFNHSRFISCEQAEADRRLAADPRAAERASEELIRNSTKPCPRCGRRIEKNDGCNEMICGKNTDGHGSINGCGHVFCWICLKPWEGHRGTYFNCQEPRV